MKRLIVNLKHYENSTGKQAESFITSLAARIKRDDVKVSFAVGPYDLRIKSTFANEDIIAQHVDPNPQGPFTGKISMEFLAKNGISSSLLNHSENRVGGRIIQDTVTKARKIGFEIILCLESIDEIRNFITIKPTYVAYEPPELIGGNISVSKSKPEIISEASDICLKNNCELIVGAGIKTAEDVSKSIELGASGILVASGIVLSKDPLGSLNSLIKAL
ncbi:MAG: triose-phosphate isomerase [Thermoplasmata archaeon]